MCLSADFEDGCIQVFGYICTDVCCIHCSCSEAAGANEEFGSLKGGQVARDWAADIWVEHSEGEHWFSIWR